MLLFAFVLCTIATDLNTQNWDSLTAGKTVFLKFFAPWCGHCKAMAPAWEKLTEAFAGHESALVAEVDCTAEDSKSLCNDNGVQGFPTLKYGAPSDLQDYQGGRDFDALKKFADENLKPICGINNLDLCEPEEKAEIDALLAMSVEDLDKIIEEMNGKITEAEVNT
jgi:protein disulfide-isomerase-like protein